MAAQRIKNLGDELQEQSLATIPVPETTVTGVPNELPPVTIVVGRKMKINMGNFEGVELFASISQTIPASTDYEALAAELSDKLDALQAPELQTAQNLTSEPHSFVHGFHFE